MAPTSSPTPPTTAPTSSPTPPTISTHVVSDVVTDVVAELVSQTNAKAGGNSPSPDQLIRGGCYPPVIGAENAPRHFEIEFPTPSRLQRPVVYTSLASTPLPT